MWKWKGFLFIEFPCQLSVIKHGDSQAVRMDAKMDAACRKTNPTNDAAARVSPVPGAGAGQGPTAVQSSCAAPVPRWGVLPVPQVSPIPREHLQQELCWWRGAQTLLQQLQGPGEDAWG